MDSPQARLCSGRAVDAAAGARPSEVPASAPPARRALLRRAVQLALAGVVGVSGAEPTAPRVTVLYPETSEPYRSVFARMIDGIEDRLKTHVNSVAVGATPDARAIAARLPENSLVIALGRQGVRASAGLERTVRLVIGAVLSLSEHEPRAFAVSTLIPDPALVFDQLHQLLPAVRRVYVVYDPQQNATLLRLAQAAARARGLELMALQAADLAAAMGHYRDLFVAANPKTDALWLIPDATTVQESLVLPLVLRNAWDSAMPLVSYNVGHVRQGALFALYPDSFEYGRYLGGLALAAAGGAAPAPEGATLRQVFVALNTKTAQHLLLNLNTGQLGGIRTFFPEH